MSIVLQSSGGGSVTIAEPTTASNFTQTLPASTGTIMVSGNMPAFSAYRATSNQSITTNVWTKVALNAEQFDTANAFDSTTNYRFTPQVAGYYQCNAQIYYGAASGMVYFYASIYKNGVSYSSNVGIAISGVVGNAGLSSLIYLNGSTDYIELYGNSPNGTTVVFGTTTSTFEASLVRAA
jgi:hypothetical protein